MVATDGPMPGTSCSSSTVAARIAFTETMAIEETLAALDLATLEKIVAMISKSRRVLVYGTGASGLVASDFQHKLFRIGRDAYTSATATTR